ncbi:MAG: DUF2946 family protein [Rhodocyclaceae bacterium]|nr:DUF2946 family protein [Rhodocyclaceae bacterium]
MARWPNVPAVYGWLGLDRRGNWRLRDETVHHPGLRDFLGRNYASDATGRYFVQNGPQRVFVALAYTPWVLRFEQDALIRHDRRVFAQPTAALIDDRGSLLVLGADGIGLVDDRDLPAMLDRLCDDRGRPLADADVEAALEGDTHGCRLAVHGRSLTVGTIAHDAVAARYGFEPRPQPDSDNDH